MILQKQKLNDFFSFAKRRQRIYLRKQAGEKQPWTDDPVLQRYYFCNIFRENDRTTIWVKKHIREPHRNSPDIVFFMAVARLINRIETLERIYPLLDNPHALGFWKEFKHRLRDVRPIITGAYMIKTPTGLKKLDGVIEVLRPIRGKAKMFAGAESLQELHKRLCRLDFIGPFLAYEIVTDIRHTDFMPTPDINTWANPGPGAARGLRILLDGPERLTKQQMLVGMQVILEESRGAWPSNWQAWEMREVEHTLCEYDKYCRGRDGQHLKRRYRGAGLHSNIQTR